MQRFHISKRGAPAICKAKKGRCPLGGESEHYNSWTEAQNAADKENEKVHGLIATTSTEAYKRANTEEDLAHISKRRKEMFNERNSNKKYISRCKRSIRLKKYVPKAQPTEHFSEDRLDRNKKIEEIFGRGETLGYYKVNHEVRGMYMDQIVEIKDTGQIKIYDTRDGSLVTTFMSHKQRIEIMMINAKDIPDKAWLEEVQKNRDIAKVHGLN